MGGDCFKACFCHKKAKGSSASAKSKGSKWKKRAGKKSSIFTNGSTLGMPVEDVAATRIQTAFRAYKELNLGAKICMFTRRLCILTAQAV